MATFVDRHGRAWELLITLGDLPALRAAGLDLGREGGVPGDLESYGRVLWLLVQGRAGDLTPEDFARGLDGPALYRALDALGDAVRDFFLPPGTGAGPTPS